MQYYLVSVVTTTVADVIIVVAFEIAEGTYQRKPGFIAVVRVAFGLAGFTAIAAMLSSIEETGQ